MWSRFSRSKILAKTSCMRSARSSRKVKKTFSCLETTFSAEAPADPCEFIAGRCPLARDLKHVFHESVVAFPPVKNDESTFQPTNILLQPHRLRPGGCGDQRPGAGLLLPAADRLFSARTAARRRRSAGGGVAQSAVSRARIRRYCSVPTTPFCSWRTWWTLSRLWSST